MRRYAAKADTNQPEIVEALRDAGCYVQLLHTVGGGTPDLLCGRGGVTYLLEVKDPKAARRSKAKELTPAQVKWHAEWRGRPVAVVESAEEALAVIGMGVQPPSAEVSE